MQDKKQNVEFFEQFWKTAVDNQLLQLNICKQHSVNDFAQNSISKIYKDKILFDYRNFIKAFVAIRNFLQNNPVNKNEVLFLGTNPEIQSFTQNAALLTKQVCLTTKWRPGLLTNWGRYKNNFVYYSELGRDFQKMDYYGVAGIKGTYSHKLDILKKYTEIEQLWTGMLGFTPKSRPKLLIVINSKINMGAIREAHRCSIPVIALLDSTLDPRQVTFPVICNTENVISEICFLELVSKLLILKQ